MIDGSRRAAWLSSRVTALGQFRRELPIEALCAAGVTAARHEDCGSRTQLGVTMSERAGVSSAVLRVGGAVIYSPSTTSTNTAPAPGPPLA
jgi:hypothetical protein